MTKTKFEVVEEYKAGWGVIVWTQLSTRKHRLSAKARSKQWIGLLTTWSLREAREAYNNWVRWLGDKKLRDVLFVLYNLSEEKYKRMGEMRREERT